MITTARLLLRPWRKTDLPAMAAINANPEVMHYFPSVQTEEQTKGFMGRQHFQQQERGHCYFAAELQATGQLIGFIGLSYQDYPSDFTPCVDIGWRLHPNAWGYGYATEGAKACIDFAREQLDLAEIVAVAVKANLPSIKVMERIGMVHHSNFLHPALKDFPELEECVLYKLVL